MQLLRSETDDHLLTFPVILAKWRVNLKRPTFLYYCGWSLTEADGRCSIGKTATLTAGNKQSLELHMDCFDPTDPTPRTQLHEVQEVL